MKRECFTREGIPKRRWDTRAEAKAHARALGDLASDQQPYRCGVCGYFHLGHYPNHEHLRLRHRSAS